ncbi:MAG: hypothetical protein QM396_01805 [Euryarchaeota archaeon]|jgi:hypothetical protein|uniref:hypothetical protein n=1 Tax=Methanobacterium sp. MZD130B TaxID=3394378 RepID=UPI0009D5FE7D|nr:hypothetical protein [Euryarchaeota archaeon]OPZ93704.1 MAG: hypothetical protein BWY74_01028 [Firmicutes bacterium ADurb.Bin419]HHT19091.1 hypothetical protein [Methanobacterium sp.]
MLEGYIKLNGQKLPRTLLGTSPFIGAPQFGHRARLYILDLYRKPEAMAKIMVKSYQLGVRGIQLLPYPPVVEALEIARDEGCPLDIIGTTRPEEENHDIELLSNLGAKAIILHATITDKGDWNNISSKLNDITDFGAIAGLATHLPFKTTAILLESSVRDDFQLYMVPVNRLGYLMDCDTHGPDEREHLRKLIHKLGKTVIAKKVLAAGIMTPDDAFDYLKTLNYVDMVALGIASEDEAEETFHKLFQR